ncbi:unnamed protein product [Peronospora effusa]|nr:unnamed protein product [Peronospora effusa]
MLPASISPPGFSSSLRAPLQVVDAASVSSPLARDMSVGNELPDLENLISDIASSSLALDFDEFPSESIDTTSVLSDSPIWAKAATNRRALLANFDADPVEISSINYQYV